MRSTRTAAMDCGPVSSCGGELISGRRMAGLYLGFARVDAGAKKFSAKRFAHGAFGPASACAKSVSPEPTPKRPQTDPKPTPKHPPNRAPIFSVPIERLRRRYEAEFSKSEVS